MLSLQVHPAVLVLPSPKPQWVLIKANEDVAAELVSELRSDYTIVIVTHNMQQAARVSDYTAYMFLGEMIEFGKTDEIFIKPKDKRTEDYITGRMG